MQYANANSGLQEIVLVDILWLLSLESKLVSYQACFLSFHSNHSNASSLFIACKHFFLIIL